MALSEPRIIYGIHSMTPIARGNTSLPKGMPYGYLKVIGSGSLSLTTEQEQLYAGSNKFPWASEAKTTSAELSAKVKAYPGFLFELFLGATVTDVSGDAAGTVSVAVNAEGDSVIDAVTGVDSVEVIPTTGAANLKFGRYVVKVLTSTTLGIYPLSDIDFRRGTVVTYADDTLQVGSPITITSGGNTDVAALGLRFVGGSGTIGMTVGDTAIFDVFPPSSSYSRISIGGASDSIPEFACDLIAQKRATGEMFEIRAHKVTGAGLPILMEENAFSQPELKGICSYDATEDEVISIRYFKP